jgi:hypothetical protein
VRGNVCDVIDSIKQGTRLVATSAFRRAGGGAEDPTTAELRINPPPDGGSNISIPATDPTVVHVSPGVYEYAHIPNYPGRWVYAWVGTSPITGVNAVDEAQVIVERRAVD